MSSRRAETSRGKSSTRNATRRSNERIRQNSERISTRSGRKSAKTSRRSGSRRRIPKSIEEKVRDGKSARRRNEFDKKRIFLAERRSRPFSSHSSFQRRRRTEDLRNFAQLFQQEKRTAQRNSTRDDQSSSNQQQRRSFHQFPTVARSFGDERFSSRHETKQRGFSTISFDANSQRDENHHDEQNSPTKQRRKHSDRSNRTGERKRECVVATKYFLFS